MKKKIIGLLVVLIALVTCFTVISAQNFDIYKDAEKVNYTEMLDDKDSVTIYYFYQETCHYCNNIKDQVSELYLAVEERTDINLVLVDMQTNVNSNAWIKEDEKGTYDPDSADLTDLNNFRVTGTPTMVYVVNGEIISQKAGIDVFEIMNKANTEYDLGLTFDSSKYSS